MAIAPDLGERYLDTIYQTNWLKDLYGEDVLSSATVTESDRRLIDAGSLAGPAAGGATERR